jgi:hypothetical protein
MKITVVQDVDKKAWRDEYQNAVSTLTQIKEAQSLTNTEAVQAVKYMAKVLLFVVKLLAKSYN